MEIVSTLLAATCTAFMLATPVTAVAPGNRNKTASVHSSHQDNFFFLNIFWQNCFYEQVYGKEIILAPSRISRIDDTWSKGVHRKANKKTVKKAAKRRSSVINVSSIKNTLTNIILKSAVGDIKSYRYIGFTEHLRIMLCRFFVICDILFLCQLTILTAIAILLWTII